ncbi:FliM/FliN family flagellar motor C-terminal domain-containing protein [Paracoccus sp. S3-43]|uniref:FliM/FliN family flagellar motor switch protein n=1 Tax=Paracoccus sp. S3-43 TaxID=3030011 RepID=UPI0023AEB784|nr:FliM/FliN family flagellar motor C-terminal domain-containing protein [Paracoccus sp. S3-43]WEF25322.1 FliM/FliN family flagellar motor C-terminal domain-containing protein [Paracoccus sp. S3-43]
MKTLLRARKGDPDKPGRIPQPQPLSPARAAANAVGRAAERLYRMPVLPVEIRPGVATLADLPELLPDPSLLIVLQGPGDQIGVMALGFETVTALIEVQALGRITARPAERRRLTRSDAAICVDFVNALMSELGTEMAGVEGFGPIQGYRYATHLDDPRPLMLMLEDRPYRSLGFDLRFGGAETRDGRILIAVPHKSDTRPALPQPAARNAAPEGPVTQPDAAPVQTLARAMADAPVEVVGVLCRRTMTLGDLRALVPGKLMALPRVTLTDARLETPDGQLLATGKLGEAEGCHALRLHDAAGTAPPPRLDPVSPPVAPPPADLTDNDPFRAVQDRDAPGGEVVAARSRGA